MSIPSGCGNGFTDRLACASAPLQTHSVNYGLSGHHLNQALLQIVPECQINGISTPLLMNSLHASVAADNHTDDEDIRILPHSTTANSLASYHRLNFSQDTRLTRSSSRESTPISDKAPTGLSVFSDFKIKLESDNGSPFQTSAAAGRSLSLHSLPSTSAPPFYLLNPTGLSSGSERFIVEKCELEDDVDITGRDTNQNERPTLGQTYGNSVSTALCSGYVSCASLDPARQMTLQSHLVNHFRSDPFHLPVFSNQGTHPSPLASQGTLSGHPLTVNASIDANSTVLSDTFDSRVTPHPSPNFVMASSSLALQESSTKRANSNGVCTNFIPCDLSSSGLPLGLSPRSKARRYSYPYEPAGSLCKLYNKEFSVQSQFGDRLCSNTPSPSSFRTSLINEVSSNTGPVALTANGGRCLSTPVSSCIADETHQVRNACHMLDQKALPSDSDVPLPGFSSPESAFYQYQHRMEGQRCQVCGELAAGFHHGAYVCEACKKFFMRHSLTNTKPTNVCPTGGNCVVAKGSRGKCQICRYRKCLYVGMKMKDPETQPDIDISNIPCRVCGGRSSGFHFGALTCEGCKGFFRRTEGSAGSLVCVGGQNACTITPRSRNACKSCRFRRCLAAGMSKKGSRIGRQPNAVKFHCAIEIKQLRSLRGCYPGANDAHANSLVGASGGSSNPYTSFGLDLGRMFDNPSSISIHDRSEAGSPKYSPDELTPSVYSANKRDSNVWVNEQKPPLSLLLLLPRASDPIDVTSNCGSYVVDGSGRSQYSPNFHRSPSVTAISSRERNDSEGCGTESLSQSAHLPTSDQEPMVEHAPRSVSDEDEVVISSDEPNPSHSFGCQALVSRTASGSSLYRKPSSNGNHIVHDPSHFSSILDEQACSSFGSGKLGVLLSSLLDSDKLNPTIALIANMSKRLCEEGEEERDLFLDIEEASTSCPPSHEAIVRFMDGMRTATEFLRLPNTYFKTRFRMTSIPLDIRDSAVQVWNHMMNHFHMHAQQIVQFAKLVPGFNQLGITARSNLVRGAMYPVVLLLLSRDYEPETDAYNYFDFSLDERSVILHHFPTFNRFTEHLRMAGRLLHHLGLSLPELSLSSAVEILRNYQTLEEPARSSTKELFALAYHSLHSCMIRRSDTSSELDDRRRWAQLVALSRLVQAMNREHHNLLSSLKDLRSDLHFPELYVEMFQLADSASALFSASAKTVTLACSSAFQSLAPLKLSLCQSTVQATSVSGTALSDSGESSETADFSQPGFLPTGDRWDASRFALAVPAAVAAVAAVAAAEASHHQQQNQLPGATSFSRPPPEPSESSTSYFSTPSSFFFPPTNHPSS